MTGKTTSNTRTKGQKAEDIAADHLTRSGYTIIERNFQSKMGEIDIIARHNGELVFVEVRSRHSPSGLDPAYSVNHYKQNKLVRTAKLYLSRRFIHVPPARFDVVVVTLDGTTEVRIIPDAFRADGYAP